MEEVNDVLFSRCFDVVLTCNDCRAFEAPNKDDNVRKLIEFGVEPQHARIVGTKFDVIIREVDCGSVEALVLAAHHYHCFDCDVEVKPHHYVKVDEDEGFVIRVIADKERIINVITALANSAAQHEYDVDGRKKTFIAWDLGEKLLARLAEAARMHSLRLIARTVEENANSGYDYDDWLLALETDNNEYIDSLFGRTLSELIHKYLP